MRLPVSGLQVQFLVPDGNDDLTILEAAGNATERALAVLPRLARLPSLAQLDEATEWGGLTVTDFEAGLLGLRRYLLGDTLRCVFRCAERSCGERMEVELSIAAFLEDIVPKRPRGTRESATRAGWYELEGVRFRLASVADQVAVLGRRDAAERLAERSIEVEPGAVRGASRAQRAMAAMAPVVSRPVAGKCAACGATVNMQLHVPTLVMDELRMGAAGVYGETHIIARAYHWPEPAILAMPQVRRQAYAEMIRQAAV